MDRTSVKKSIMQYLDMTEDINDFIRLIINRYKENGTEDAFTDGELIFFRDRDECERIANGINALCGRNAALVDYCESSEHPDIYGGCHYIWFP